MRSQTLILTGNTTDFTTNLSPQIRLDPSKKYEAALLSINLYNTIPNITDKNNRFEYSPDNGSTWKGFHLNIGAYEVSGINDEIQSKWYPLVITMLLKMNSTSRLQSVFQNQNLL